jgi:hypothetical protein
MLAAGDDVDVEDGEWELLYLYRVEDPATSQGSNNPRYHFAGYYTIFAFSNPLKGKCLRVCQALILPTYQRQGESIIILKQIAGNERREETNFRTSVQQCAAIASYAEFDSLCCYNVQATASGS